MNKAKFHIPLLYRKWDDCKIVKIKLPFKKNSSLKNDYDNLNIKKNQDVSAKFLWTFSHTVTKVLVELDKAKGAYLYHLAPVVLPLSLTLHILIFLCKSTSDNKWNQTWQGWSLER